MLKELDQSNALPWTRLDWLAILLLGLGAILGIARFWQPGVASGADMLMGIYRVFELDWGWRQGVLYPRLGENLNFTYGAPLFQFYPPLTSFSALAWRWAGLGWIEATKATFTIGLVLAGLGAYTYARWLFRDRQAGFVAGAAYLFAPYILTNIYERGAAAESLALGLVPWVFWALHRALAEPNRHRIALGGILVGFLILAHNITALFVLPAVLVYLLILARRAEQMRQMAAVAAAVGLGLGLSAFYWLPAIAEIGSTQAEATMLSGALSATENLAPLADLVQRSLVVDYWGGGRFHLALWQALVFALSMVAIPFQAVRVRLALILLAGLALLALFMQLTIARVFWESLPMVRFVQFPWRLLGLASFCAALLTGSIFLLRPLRGIPGTVLAAALLLVIVVVGLLRLTPDLSPIWYKIGNDQISQMDLFERGRAGFALFTDYTPQDLQIQSLDLSLPRPPGASTASPLQSTPDVQVLSEGPTHLRVRVKSDTAVPLRLHRVYFPGWRATVDGQAVPVEPAGQHGLVSIEAPAGDHEVLFRYTGTPLQQIATVASLVAVVALVVLIAGTRRRGVALALIAGLAVAILLLVIWKQTQAERSRQPTPVTATFADEVRLLGYVLPKDSWQPGATLPVRLYWFAQKVPTADYTVFLHLVPLDDSGQLAQVDSPPVLGFSPTTRWEPGEVIVDEQQLRLDSALAPGTYRLVLGLYRSDTVQNLPVSGAVDTLPGDRIVLGEIEIQQTSRDPQAE